MTVFEDRKTLISAGCAGVVFVVLILAAVLVGGSPADSDAPAGEIREYLTDNRGPLLFSALLGFLLATVAHSDPSSGEDP